MSHSAPSDPLVVAWPLDESIEKQILSQRSESPKLDWKETIDLSASATKDKVELARDVAAFANSEGGYIVFGIADDGSVKGVSPQLFADFDEALIRQKVEPFVSPVPSLFVHPILDFQGQRLIILVILPSPHSPLVMTEVGNYKDPASSRLLPLFQPGDVFVRRGTICGRWQQDDVVAIVERIREREKEKWLREITPFLKILAAQGGSSSTPTLHDAPSPYEDAISYGKSLQVLFRASDERALRAAMLTCVDVAREQWRSTKGKSEEEVMTIRDDHLRLVLDRLALIGVLATSNKVESVLEGVVDALVKVYTLGEDRALGFQGASAEHLSASMVWRHVLVRVYTIGAAVVQNNLISWTRRLVLQKVSAQSRLPWLRWTQVTLSRESRWEANSLIPEVVNYIREHPEFRHDLDVGGDELLENLCQFDFLQVAIARFEYGMREAGFPSFAGYHTHRTLPMIKRAITDPAVREAIGKPDDALLADTLRDLDLLCAHVFFNYAGWDTGFDDDTTIKAFLDRNPSTGASFSR